MIKVMDDEGDDDRRCGLYRDFFTRSRFQLIRDKIRLLGSIDRQMFLGCLPSKRMLRTELPTISSS